MKHAASIGLIVATLALGACVFAPGGPGDWDDDDVRRVRPTAGQELLDLDRARDAGVISEAEYERARERILDAI